MAKRKKSVEQEMPPYIARAYKLAEKEESAGRQGISLDEAFVTALRNTGVFIKRCADTYSRTGEVSNLREAYNVIDAMRDLLRKDLKRRGAL